MNRPKWQVEVLVECPKCNEDSLMLVHIPSYWKSNHDQSDNQIVECRHCNNQFALTVSTKVPPKVVEVNDES